MAETGQSNGPPPRKEEAEVDVHWKSSTKFFVAPSDHPPALSKPLIPLPNEVEFIDSGNPAVLSTSSSMEKVENLLLPDVSDVGLEKSKSRTEWKIHTQPRLEHVCDAILQDNMEQIANFLTAHPTYKIRGLTFPVKIESRAGNILTSKAMTLGHLFTLFSTPKTLQFLETKGLLVNGIFRLRCDMEVEYLSVDITLGRSNGDELQNYHRSIPCSFMATLRDNLPTLLWLIYKGYLRRHANEVDSTGRNILHACVDEESPLIMQELLNNRHILSSEILIEMLRTRESKDEETPFMKAAAKADPVMLVLCIHTCPDEFVAEREDLSGIGKSVFTFLLGRMSDPTLAMQVVKEFLKRGAVPDRHVTDDSRAIEAVIGNDHFSGPDLKHAVKILLKYGAKPTSGALLKLLRLRFRTDEELGDLFKLLLKAGGTRVLLGESAYKQWASRQDSPGSSKASQFSARDGNSVVTEILKNKRIGVSKMERLLVFINEYADISSMFPDADGIALAISERMAFDPTQDQHVDLENILRLLLRFACSHQDEDSVRGFLDRLLRGLLRYLFERNDYSKAEKPYEKVVAYIGHYLHTMENLDLDFNAVVDGQIGLFSFFHPNVPDEVVLKILDILPKSFDRNLLTGQSENLATLAIKRFCSDFEMVHKVFSRLKDMGFDFTQTVHSGETLLMVYVRKCGETFDQMETDDTLTAYVEEDFFKVMRFLFSEKVDMTHKATTDELKEVGRINVLGVAMMLKHCTIAEEILKINPLLLESVHVETVLSFIRNCPEVLEFLNGRSLLLKCRSHAGGLDNVDDLVDPNPTSQLDTSFSNKNCLTTIRSVWLNYVQHRHEAILKFVGESSSQDNCYSKQVELIYDYLVHCSFEHPEDPESYPSKVAMEFSVFRRPELDNLPHTLETVSKERVNAPLFIKIVEECDSIEKHPLFTEYFEKFYRAAFFNSLIFILYHILFLVILNGCMTNVVTPVTHYAETSPIFLPRHFRCLVNNCTVANLTGVQRSYVIYDTANGSSCAPIAGASPRCFQCPAHTTSKSFCIDAKSATKWDCPFTLHLHIAWINPLMYLLLAMAVIGLLRESIQLVMDPLDYMRSYIQNPVELSMYLFVILFAINISHCPDNAGFKTTWQFQLGIIAVLNSWFMLFFYMSKFPAFATYVIMFYQAVKSGLWLLVTFSSLLLGFGFTFHLLLGNQVMYRKVYTSLNKVWLMIAGEIDYKDTMTGMFESPKDETKQIHFEILTRAMLIIFILLVSIVLMNLFIGLIVGDVDTINKMAENKKWKWNLEFIEYTDAMRDFFNKWFHACRRCCGGKDDSLEAADPYSRERRATLFVIEQQSRKMSMAETEKAGLYVTDLSWRNLFKWYIDFNGRDIAKWGPVAGFFGFVARKELLKRLMVMENRKRKLRSKYSNRRRLERIHVTVLQVEQATAAGEGEIIKKVNLPAMMAAPVSDPHEESEPESEVTIHDENLLQVRKLTRPAYYATDESIDGPTVEGSLAIGHFLPRHERRAQRRLFRPPSSTDVLNGENPMIGVGVPPPRPYYPSLARSRVYTRPGNFAARKM